MPSLFRPTERIPSLSDLIKRNWVKVPVRGLRRLPARWTERLYQSWTAFHAQEELSRLSQRDWYDNEIFWRDDIPYIVQYGYHWSIVRHDEIEQLLALEDRDLTAMGLHRGDLEAYRDGRIKFLNRKSAAQPTAADQDNARHGN